MRLFVAVDPGERLRRELDTRLDAWRLRLDLAWVRPENLHATLLFLGEQPDGLRPRLETALRAVAARHTPFALRAAGVGGFPRLSSPRVLFLQMDSGGALERLAADVRATVAPLLAGGLPDDKPFRAHLTLARVKRPLAPAESRLLAGMDLGSWDEERVSELCLVRSELGRGGPRYSDLAVMALAAAAG